MELTPGMRYIGRWIVSSILPIIGLFVVVVRLLAFAGIYLSVGGSVALLTATLLTIQTAHVVSIEIYQRRRAAALGARLIPEIRGYLPGNVDKLFELIRRIETDYIGNLQIQIHHSTMER